MSISQYIVTYRQVTQNGVPYAPGETLLHVSAYTAEDAEAQARIQIGRKLFPDAGYEILGVWPYVEQGHHSFEVEVQFSGVIGVRALAFCRDCDCEREHPIHDERFKDEY